MTHGKKSTYDRHRCRCEECRAANTAYQRDRRKQIAAMAWRKGKAA